MKLTKLACAISSAFLMTACGSSSDPDSGSASSASISGFAYDGYIAYGTVYHDSNNNERLDSWEANAITDQDGYFSVAADGTDYCGLATSDNRRIHCLQSTFSGGSVRVTGGYDLFTGQQFDGSMSKEFDPENLGTPISPITSLLNGLDESDATTLLTTLGLTTDDVEADLLNDANINGDTFGKIYELHKVVQVLESAVEGQYDAIGEEDFPTTLSGPIYEVIAEELLAGTDLESLSSRTTQIRASLQSKIDDIYEAGNEARPSDEQEGNAPTLNTNINTALTRAEQVSSLVGTLFDDETTQPADELKGLARTVEVVVEKIERDPNASNQAEIDRARDAATGTGADNDDYRTALEGDEVNFNSLVENNYSNVGTLDDSADVTGADDFSSIDSMSLTFSDDNEADFDAEAIMYFASGQDGQAGELKLCLSYSETNSDEFNVDGELLDGTWNVLPGSTNSVLVTIELAGTKSVILTSLGNMDYEFTFAGDTGSYRSDTGLVSTGTVPTTDEECQQQLGGQNESTPVLDQIETRF